MVLLDGITLKFKLLHINPKDEHYKHRTKFHLVGHWFVDGRGRHLLEVPSSPEEARPQ